ncbi:hypothetical protein BGW80DRAFT_1366517 [Lactifluus volemus]|nr:hypothetical protein BGW80DRAFT_1366517 [Lactifluus volemus]
MSDYDFCPGSSLKLKGVAEGGVVKNTPTPTHHESHLLSEDRTRPPRVQSASAKRNTLSFVSLHRPARPRRTSLTRAA